MDVQAIFGLSILLSFVASGLVFWMFVWPRLKELSRNAALRILVIPHTFRFIGLSFLVSGVVSPAVPAAFAAPAAYGDLVAASLAAASVLALYYRFSFAPYLVWIFNIWGTFDFLYAFYAGLTQLPSPSALGAAFYIPTLIVPPFFITHLLIFRLLVMRDE